MAICGAGEIHTRARAKFRGDPTRRERPIFGAAFPWGLEISRARVCISPAPQIRDYSQSIPTFTRFSSFYQETNVRNFNFFAISTHLRSNFSMNAAMHGLQVSFCENNSTWRNDISCKNFLNRLICVKINTSTFVCWWLWSRYRVTWPKLPETRHYVLNNLVFPEKSTVTPSFLSFPYMSWSLSNCSKTC